MYTQIFEEIGLTPNEAKIYETLINEGSLNISSIALQAGIHRRNTYDAVNRLLAKSLIFLNLGKGENTYQAAAPARLIEIIKNKEDQLTSILPFLESQYSQGAKKQQLFIYRGLEGLKNYFKDILNAGVDVQVIYDTGFLFSDQTKNLFGNFFAEAKILGLKEKHIFLASAKDKADNLQQIGGINYKLLDQENPHQLMMSIFGDYVVQITGSENKDEFIFYVVIDHSLALGYKTFFDFLWHSRNL